MAVEKRRGCGYRKVGGLYLCGGGIGMTCDRLPLPIEPCPVCAERPRFTRSFESIYALQLFGTHEWGCNCPESCPVCRPPNRGYLMWVGEEYTPESFILEGEEMGVSKKIPALPVDLKLREDWVFLAYAKLIPRKGKNMLLPFGGEESTRYGFQPGIFYAFRPQRLEMIVTESQAKDEERMKMLRRKHIHPIVVPDDDQDHNPRAKKKEGDDGDSESGEDAGGS